MSDVAVNDVTGSWWPTFRHILVTGAEIAIKVLPILLTALEDGAEDDLPQEWKEAIRTGPVAWQANRLGGTVQVANVDELGREMLVTFTPAFGDTSVGEMVLLTAPGTPGDVAPVTSDLKSLIGGQIAVTALPAPTPKDVKTKVLAPFAIGALAGAGAVALNGGWTFTAWTDRPTPERREFGASLRGADLPQTAELSARHPQSGVDFTLRADRRNPPSATDEATIEFRFPPGVVTEATDALEDIVITVETTYDAIRSLARTGP